MGIDVNRLIPQSLQEDRPHDFELWPEHWLAWTVYLGCGSQWRKTVINTWNQVFVKWEGLDYTGVRIVMEHYRVPRRLRDEVFAQLQVLEAETLAIRNHP